MRRFSRWEIALHESGHAVVRVAFNDPIHRVVVLHDARSDSHHGFVEPVPGAVDKPRRRPLPTAPLVEVAAPERSGFAKMVRAKGLEAYAGIACQFYTEGSDWWSAEMHFASSEDRLDFQRLVAVMGWHRVDPCFVTLRLAREFVDRRWGKVLSVAEALRVKDELSGDEVRRLVAEAPERPNEWRSRLPPARRRPIGEFRCIW